MNCFVLESLYVHTTEIQNNVMTFLKNKTKLLYRYTCGLKECMLIVIIVYIPLLVKRQDR